MRRPLLLLTLCAGCSAVNSVKAKTGFGYEARPDVDRKSTGLGVKMGFVGGFTPGCNYRIRNDSDYALEHAVFCDVEVLVWQR